jgi:glycosyltransferase involved in cell wall biosynthesis
LRNPEIMSEPKVSVVMPAYNAERHVAHAIESILSQTFTALELLVIDDGSEDRTAQIVQEYGDRDPRVRLFRHGTNRNICIALNAGIRSARGPYIARMDADDWSYPYRLERQVAFMDTHPEVGVSGGTIEVCDDQLRPLNRRTYRRTDAEIRQRLFRYSPFAHPAVIYRTSAARAVGGYDPSLADAEDYDFYFRLGVSWKFANLPDLLLRLRTTDRSISQSRGRRQERLTIATRFKARAEYGYSMSPLDLVYTLLQYISSIVIPPRIKFWLFNRLRGRTEP